MPAFAARLALFLAIHSIAYADVTHLWSDLTAKRQALTSYHQEFDRTISFILQDHTQTGRRSIILDGSGARWSEHFISGAGDWSYLFDGSGLFRLEAGEYTLKKLGRDEEVPEPEPYEQASVDLRKGVEVKRFPCGLSGASHECVALDLPVKPRSGSSPNAPNVTGGERRIIIDSITGLVLFSHTIENFQRRDQRYQADISINSKRVSWNGVVDPAVFRIPSGYAEVKELSKWDAKKMNKQLTGKAAPDLMLLDINGKVIKLSELRGKTVLLDFWTTWCGPCRADGPSLDKLAKKYGDRELQIIGVSVDEDRATVQRFLKDHPHGYPIALTTENEMPRAYQIGVFPTYVIIDSDGNFAEATEGTSGFRRLKKLLTRAGLDAD